MGFLNPTSVVVGTVVAKEIMKGNTDKKSEPPKGGGWLSWLLALLILAVLFGAGYLIWRPF